MKRKGINKINKEFTAELEELINKYSLEGGSNTPDYILAEYLTMCLKTFNKTMQKREARLDKPIDERTPLQRMADVPDNRVRIHPSRPSIVVGEMYYIKPSGEQLNKKLSPQGTICKCEQKFDNGLIRLSLINPMGKELETGLGGWLALEKTLNFEIH